MIVVIGVGLYTVRAILDLLGVVDYGIYNVVGGVVAMFSFINGTLTSASQRYFSIELAKGNLKKLNQWFCLHITTFLLLILLFLLIAETIGLWFVNTQMTIPSERLVAANVVYQLSIISFCIAFFSIPYNALIIAHEKMRTFAYISIVEALLKLVIVYILTIIPWDKLIIYSILMLLVSCGITIAYIIYDRKHFPESKFYLYWNKTEIRELFGFTGWHFFGTFSMVIRSQGINILINMFFNPVINAARAIAFQVYNAVSQLSGNFFTAVKPEIYKLYANGEYEALYKLILRSTIISALLISILAFPLLGNTAYVLGLWLKEVPEHSVIFTQLVLINGLIDAINGPIIASALATGKIRKYQQIVATLIFLNLPISYLALKMGTVPQMTVIISIFISIITTVVRVYLLRSMIGFPIGKYFCLLFRLLIVSIFILSIIYLTMYNIAINIVMLLIISVIILMLTVIVYMIFIFDRSDAKTVVRYIKSRIIFSTKL